MDPADRIWRLVAETIEAQGAERYGVVTRVAHQLGVGVESLRSCVNQVKIDRGTSVFTGFLGAGVWDRQLLSDSADDTQVSQSSRQLGG